MEKYLYNDRRVRRFLSSKIEPNDMLMYSIEPLDRKNGIFTYYIFDGDNMIESKHIMLY